MWVEVMLQAFLTAALDEGEWSTLRPSLFIHGVRNPSIHWIGGWVGPNAGLDGVAKRKSHIIIPAGN
jgi:hypothetical protein